MIIYEKKITKTHFDSSFSCQVALKHFTVTPATETNHQAAQSSVLNIGYQLQDIVYILLVYHHLYMCLLRTVWERDNND